MSIGHTWGEPLEPVKPARRDLRADTIGRLAKGTMQIAGALYLAQRGQCFHCGGAMPLFGKREHPGACSREHAMAASDRPGHPMINGACVLAHKVCNAVRDDRPLTATEWRRAGEIWAIADRLWIGSNGARSQLPIWIELAKQQQQETT